MIIYCSPKQHASAVSSAEARLLSLQKKADDSQDSGLSAEVQRIIGNLRHALAERANAVADAPFVSTANKGLRLIYWRIPNVHNARRKACHLHVYETGNYAVVSEKSLRYLPAKFVRVLPLELADML